MQLPNDLLAEFAKLTAASETQEPQTKTLYGTIYGNGTQVKIDGTSESKPILTPIASYTTKTDDGDDVTYTGSTVGVKDGDRVTLQIKDHRVVITGNITNPSLGSNTAIQTGTKENGEIETTKITNLGIVVAEKIQTEVARVNKVVVDDLDAAKANIVELQAKDVEISGTLTATNGKITNLETSHAEITGTLEAANAEIVNLKATDADFRTLESDYATFRETTTGTLTAGVADIEKLKTEKLDAKDAELKFVNIDFANIDKAWMEELYAKSGLIEYVVAEDASITGYLVGVTIKGDLIEGNTIVADKLVIKGEDGLYYKLNTNGETVGGEQTDHNSLNGSVITAKSITAEKVSITDLVAFGATIGGFKITDDSIYSGVKSQILNTTRGVYLDNDGQFSLGDATNYLRFFNDPIYRQVEYDSENDVYRIPENAADYDFETIVNEVWPEFELDEDPLAFTNEGYPVYGESILFCIIPNYKLEISAESILFGANSRKSTTDLKALTDYVKIKTIVDEEDGNEKPCIELSEDDDKRNRKQTLTNTKNAFTEGDTVKTEVGTDGVKTTDLNASGSITHNNLVWAFRANGNCGLSWKEATN